MTGEKMLKTSWRGEVCMSISLLPMNSSVWGPIFLQALELPITLVRSSEPCKMCFLPSKEYQDRILLHPYPAQK